MLEQRVKLVSEWLARAVDRRVFLRRVGGGVVAGVATLVMGPVLARSGISPASAQVPLLTYYLMRTSRPLLQQWHRRSQWMPRRTLLSAPGRSL